MIIPSTKYDYLASSVIQGLYKNNVKIFSTILSNGIRNSYTRVRILKESKTADYIFIFWIKYGKLDYELINKINRSSICVYIDGNDHNVKNMRMLKYCRWYFKRESYEKDNKIGIKPLLWGAEDRYFGNYNHEKTIDVLCSFGHTRRLREQIIAVCKELKEEEHNILIEFGMPYNEYLEKISRSYITIDTWGTGELCARFYEIIANKSCCFSQKFNINFPNKFIDGESFVEYSNIKEFKDKLMYYLNYKNRCLEIANNGYEHLLKYHTTEKIVKRLLSELKWQN